MQLGNEIDKPMSDLQQNHNNNLHRRIKDEKYIASSIIYLQMKELSS